MKKTLFIVLFLILLSLVATGLTVLVKGLPRNQAATKNSEANVEAPKEKVKTIVLTSEIIPATAAGTPAKVKLSIKPQKESFSLLAFDLRFLITSAKGTVSSGGSILIDSAMTKNDWSFPIKRVKSEGQSLAVEMSGIHVSSNPFNLTEEQTVAIVPVSGPEPLTIEIDDKITQFLDGKSVKLITAHEQR